jgi:hypothetical protein
MQPPSDTTPTYYKSQGGGQYFKRTGDHVKIVCLYEFNPSIEKTKYSAFLMEALTCEDATEDDFNEAESIAQQLLA